MDCIDVLQPNGADPFPIDGKNGWLYLTYTTGRDVSLWRSRTVKGFATAERKVVWRPPTTGPYNNNLWAPELHSIRGKWYVYVAADDGRNENHRMYAIRCKTNDPFTGEWEFVGKVADEKDDRWAIDGTVLELNRKLYFIWSGWEGAKGGPQNLYIAPMSDPATISGPRVLLSEPKLAWETEGINEGPEVLKYKDRVYVIYSAAGSWTDKYCLGQLTLKRNADPLKPGSWEKSPEPVFASGNGVVAPGHAGFVKDGGKDYIIYHAAKRPGSGWDRFIRAQTFTFDKSGMPQFGLPCPRTGATEDAKK